MIYRNQQIQVISSLYLEIKIQLERDIKNIGKVPGILKNKPCLTQEQERMIIDYINDQYSYHSPCSHIEIDPNPALERFNGNTEEIKVVTKENINQPKTRKKPCYGFINSHCYEASLRGLCPYCYSNLLDDEYVYIEEESEFDEDWDITEE